MDNSYHVSVTLSNITLRKTTIGQSWFGLHVTVSEGCIMLCRADPLIDVWKKNKKKRIPPFLSLLWTRLPQPPSTRTAVMYTLPETIMEVENHRFSRGKQSSKRPCSTSMFVGGRVYEKCIKLPYRSPMPQVLSFQYSKPSVDKGQHCACFCPGHNSCGIMIE